MLKVGHLIELLVFVELGGHEVMVPDGRSVCDLCSLLALLLF